MYASQALKRPLLRWQSHSYGILETSLLTAPSSKKDGTGRLCKAVRLVWDSFSPGVTSIPASDNLLLQISPIAGAHPANPLKQLAKQEFGKACRNGLKWPCCYDLSFWENSSRRGYNTFHALYNGQSSLLKKVHSFFKHSG